MYLNQKFSFTIPKDSFTHYTNITALGVEAFSWLKFDFDPTNQTYTFVVEKEQAKPSTFNCTSTELCSRTYTINVTAKNLVKTGDGGEINDDPGATIMLKFYVVNIPNVVLNPGSTRAVDIDPKTFDLAGEKPAYTAKWIVDN